MHPQAASLIDRFQLQPHPEGGYYRRVFTSAAKCGDSLHMLSTIYYLLEGTDISAFHRIKSDEVWFFHSGSGLYLHQIDEEGKYRKDELSLAGALQVAVPSRVWMAAELVDKKSFCLISCAVSPEFCFSDFELADLDVMQEAYPQYAVCIERLCYPSK